MQPYLKKKQILSGGHQKLLYGSVPLHNILTASDKMPIY